MARNLFLYHPGTGTMISLSDPVFMLDTDVLNEKAPGAVEAFQEGYATYDDAKLMGTRIDNFNMTNLFFGGAE